MCQRNAPDFLSNQIAGVDWRGGVGICFCFWDEVLRERREEQGVRSQNAGHAREVLFTNKVIPDAATVIVNAIPRTATSAAHANATVRAAGQDHLATARAVKVVVRVMKMMAATGNFLNCRNLNFLIFLNYSDLNVLNWVLNYYRLKYLNVSMMALQNCEIVLHLF